MDFCEITEPVISVQFDLGSLVEHQEESVLMANQALSSEYLVYLLEFLEDKYSVDPANLQKSLSFNLEPYLTTRPFVSFEYYAEVFAQSYAHTHDPKFHLHYAQYLTADKHGFLGYHAQSQRCIEDAIIAHVKYLKTRFNYIQYQLVKGGETSTLLIDVALKNPFFRQITVETVMKCIETIARQWLGEHTEKIRVLLEYDGNNFIEEKEAYKVTYSYGEPVTGMLIPNKVLAMPLQKFDPTLSRLCEQELKKKVLNLHEREGFADRVKRVIQENLSTPCSLSSVANELCISERTLKRRLSAEGTNFRQLLNECRMERALAELPSHSVSRVSELLGFQSQFSFSRAFKNWTGRSPSEYCST